MKKSTVSSRAALRREARRRLGQLRRVESFMEDYRRRRDNLDAMMERDRDRIDVLREEIARLVDALGGELHVPGLPRAVHFKEVRTVDYNMPRLVAWLDRHAPGYTVSEPRVNRTRLRASLRFRGGRAFLKGVSGPVDGVRVRDERLLVIPRPE